MSKCKCYKAEEVERVLEELIREPDYKHVYEEWFDGVFHARDRIKSLSPIEVDEEEETPTCSECEHYEDHHTSLACAKCPVITKVWGGTE